MSIGRAGLRIAIASVVLACSKQQERAAAPAATSASHGPQASATVSEPAPAASPREASPADFRFFAGDEGPFPNASGDKQPRVVASVELPEDARASFAEELLANGYRRTLTDEEAAELEVVAPPQVWLFGSDGPCRAELGPPYAAVYDDPTLVLELGHHVQPCTDAPAPIAFVAEQPPTARWHAVSTDVAEEVSEPARWEHALQPVMIERGFGDRDAKNPPRVHVRIRSAGPVTELGWAHHWPGDDCEESEVVDLAIGIRDGDAFTPFAPLDDHSRDAELVGALTVDARAWVVVADHRHQLRLGAIAEQSVRWTELGTGHYHDEVTAYWGFSVLEGYCGP